MKPASTLPLKHQRVNCEKHALASGELVRRHRRRRRRPTHRLCVGISPEKARISLSDAAWRADGEAKRVGGARPELAMKIEAGRALNRTLLCHILAAVY